MDYDKSVYKALSQVPRGKVTTYKLIACALGSPSSSRAVGNALNRNPDPDNVPCYRVVRSDGSIGGYSRGVEEKVRKLRADGIAVRDRKIVDLPLFLYKPKPIKRP